VRVVLFVLGVVPQVTRTHSRSRRNRSAVVTSNVACPSAILRVPKADGRRGALGIVRDVVAKRKRKISAFADGAAPGSRKETFSLTEGAGSPSAASKYSLPFRPKESSERPRNLQFELCLEPA
jgi:hypothetical protein